MKLITPIVIILICFGLYYTYISPTVMDIKSLSLKKSNYDEVLQKVEEVKKKKDDLLAEYNSISSVGIDKLNKIVPETFNSVIFVYEINVMAGKNNLVVKDFKVNVQKTEDRQDIINPQGGSVYKTSTVTFRLIGQYAQFISFLKDLESSLRITDVANLSIKTIGGDKASNESLEYLLEMNTYSLR